jgi:hypothetical protein
MDAQLRSRLQPGVRVKITQQIAARNWALSNTISGTVVSFNQQQTGSWYAHSQNDRLWLDRLTLRLDDGEITTLNLDEFSRLEIEAPSAAAPAGAKPADPAAA